MRKPQYDMNIFRQRRQNLAKELQGAALIVAAHPEHIRNHDVEYPYRQDTNLFYLTGFEEPDAIFVFRPGFQPETVMFCRRRDPEMETWNGFRYGPEGVVKEFQIDQAFPIDEFEKVAPQLLHQVEKVYYRLFKNKHFDELVQVALEKTRRIVGRSGYGLLPVFDADTLIGESRLYKSDYEADVLRKACEISADGHIDAMKFTRPGVNERQVQAILAHRFFMNGATREGYNYIVASGNSATTLHYNFNDQLCQDGDLLLIDAGAEYQYFTGDITRTFPVNGKFTEPQAKVYQGVLQIQKHLIEMVRPGVLFKEFHDTATSMLTDLMLELGLLVGRKEDLIQANRHRKYYPHGAGHWLGMDVHDAGLYLYKGEPRPIEKGMCFTIEPGLYIPYDDLSAPKELRGIGVRIEDNILVTANGHENMTAKAPKEIADMEKIIGK